MTIEQPSQQEEIKLYSCKWGWCSSNFSNNAELIHHVVHEHARSSVPVRRRDIPLIRRAEEGSGESLRMSSDQYVFPNDPRSRSAPHHDEPSGSREKISQADAGVTTPTFGSLQSPLDSPQLLAVPDSPSFSSLVNQPAKRKLHFSASENPPPKKSMLHGRHSLAQSSSLASTSSTGSQLSVELQLTQSPEDDADQDSDSQSDHSDDESSERNTPEPSVPPPSAAAGSGENLYAHELRWDLSQPEASQGPIYSQNSTSQETNSIKEEMELLSQPPSQFQYEGFPIHHHGPKKPNRNQITHLTPNSSAPLPLSIPVALPSPIFAVSTPQKQNWYTPVLKRTCSNVKTQPEIVSTPPPAQPTHTRLTRSASKSRTFKSGTLQISPVKARKPVPEPIAEEHEKMSAASLSQESQVKQGLSYEPVDCSQSFQVKSYPLLTQAPYESQS